MKNRKHVSEKISKFQLVPPWLSIVALLLIGLVVSAAADKDSATLSILVDEEWDWVSRDSFRETLDRYPGGFHLHFGEVKADTLEVMDVVITDPRKLKILYSEGMIERENWPSRKLVGTLDPNAFKLILCKKGAFSSEPQSFEEAVRSMPLPPSTSPLESHFFK